VAAAGAAIVLLGGGAYLVFTPKSAPQVTSLQDLKVEELERALEERRKAERRGGRETPSRGEAQRKVEADAAAKRAADSDSRRCSSSARRPRRSWRG